jgi:transcriptional regulator with XRE-family HTH domain
MRNPMLPTTCSSRLTWLRVQQGQSQQDLAGIAGTSQSAISRMEKGRSLPNGKQLIRIAKHYKVTTDWILGLAEHPTPSGLPVGAWIVDLDYTDAIRAEVVPAGHEVGDPLRWASAIPKRYSIMQSAEVERLHVELHPHMERLRPKLAKKANR